MVWRFDGIPEITVTMVPHDHDLPCFGVRMECDGEVRTQTVYPFDLDAVGPIIADLDSGVTPIGWDDGLGRVVCWDNATPEDPEGGEE